ncbi:MAG: inositol monophosphatase [archaeon]
MKQLINEMLETSGKIALDNLGKVSSISKGYKDVVTQADLKINEFISSKIKARFSEHCIITEEAPIVNKNSKYKWIIDPIDGTINYSHGIPFYCISIAVAENDIVIVGAVYAPSLKQMFFAQKGKCAYLNNQKISVSNKSAANSLIFYSPGIAPDDMKIEMQKKIVAEFERSRDYGALALELAYVAAGFADGVARFDSASHVWDYAAGKLLVEESGGKVTDFSGKKILLADKSDIVATNALIHDNLLNIIKNKR